MTTLSDNPKGFVIAGTHSSVGKSSISIGLMRLLKRQGYAVKPFKVGPDYIDPGHHSRACGAPSYNLDSWMSSPGYVWKLFRDLMREGDLAVVEGVMGLFDGAHSKNETGSTAQIAKLLGLPILLIVDGSAMARSAAALVKGFVEFDPDLEFLGVIGNRVNSEGHAKILQEAIEHHTSVKFLGNLPFLKELSISSRHLGLFQGTEQKARLYDRWADHIERNVGLKKLVKGLGAKKRRKAIKTNPAPSRWSQKPSGKKFKVAVARDEAFQFVYPDTLDFIKHYGGEIEFFSPLGERALPPGIDWAYFPGGYPELYAGALGSNQSMLSSVRQFGRSGKLIVGECGGMMYLGKTLIDESGKKFKMAGLFNFSTSIKNKTLTLGYRRLRLPKGPQANQPLSIKGHEFHYSRFINNNETAHFSSEPAKGKSGLGDGYIYKNCFAFYSHLYWGSSPQWMKFILSKI